jgi:hypothetical protein
MHRCCVLQIYSQKTDIPILYFFSKIENGGHLEFCNPIVFKTFSDHEKGILQLHFKFHVNPSSGS